jgi:hypothetical protein
MTCAGPHARLCVGVPVPLKGRTGGGVQVQSGRGRGAAPPHQAPTLWNPRGMICEMPAVL